MSNNPGATKSLPEETGKHLEASLKHLVENSLPPHKQGEQDALAPSEKRADAIHTSPKQGKSWISHLWPSEETLDSLFAMEHMGNYVIDRATGRKVFEAMPLYVRVGMHLLFVSGTSYLSYPSIEKLLESQSMKQGELYDKTGPTVLPHIQSFIDTYQIPLEELLVPDLTQYPTFNSFFSRRLKPSARPITAPTDPSIIVSPADARLTVYDSVDAAKRIWIKGQKFSLRSLLLGEQEADSTKDAITNKGVGGYDVSRFLSDEESTTGATSSSTSASLSPASLAIARLAPQDYHRFHSPVTGTITAIHDIPGELYTVNPQAINNDLDVFTLNKRTVILLDADLGQGDSKVPIAIVCVGAMLVGSIGITRKVGETVEKGQELGWFQYGGSTVIVVVPPGVRGVRFDADLKETSGRGMETLVRVGMEIGVVDTVDG